VLLKTSPEIKNSNETPKLGLSPNPVKQLAEEGIWASKGPRALLWIKYPIGER
jgi:hypothetical protein